MKTKILVLGGGSGGISVAARLLRMRPDIELSIIEPSEQHYYQAFWTLVGAGIGTKEATARPTSELIPQGAIWIKDRVLAVDADEQWVQITKGRVNYDYLIVATGLTLNWTAIEGLSESLGKNEVCSVYEYSKVDYAASTIKSFSGGQALFVMPPVPIKCAGAPQKIMYLAEHMWRKNGLRPRAEIHFLTAGASMFGIPTFAKPLAEIIHERGIQPHFKHRLVAVDGPAKQALFETQQDSGEITRSTYPFDLLHVVPPMSAHPYVAESKLAFTEGDQKGWLEVDKHTLQHRRFKNIFGLGDVTGIPNSKTAAAIRKQYPVVAQNLNDIIGGKQPSMLYDGYSSCPLITEYGKVMLAEFGYNGKLLPTFPLDPAKPRRAYWHLKKDFLPLMYWRGMVKGLI
jgi:sulfide:quinone oxidoreductase